jgi:glutathione synthase/RimK-type ligase-like ATP-grasp enzyme
LIFRALPEDRMVTVKTGPDGKPVYFWSNALTIPQSMLEGLHERGVEFLYPSPPSIDIRGMSWIVNLCNEPDQSRSAMHALDTVFGGNVPIFNHPRAIHMSRRDLSASVLSGIPNLIVPKTIRLMANSANDFEENFQRHGFKYPVLIRPAGSQEGAGMTKVDGPDGWAQVLYSNWRGKPHYMTQFIDYAGRDNRYSFMRVAVVGGQSFLRVTGNSHSWHIGHPHSPASPSPKPRLERWREVAQDRERYETWAEARAVVSAIAERVGLDFFGVDLGVLNSKEFVLFEANAAMSITDKFALTDEAKPFAERIYDDIIKALELHITAPDGWVYGGHFDSANFSN